MSYHHGLGITAAEALALKTRTAVGPAVTAPTSSSIVPGLMAVGVIAVGGYFAYRHFKKKGSTT